MKRARHLAPSELGCDLTDSYVSGCWENLLMNSVLDLRREVLRLAKIQNRAICLRIPQLAAFYNLPERRVREEFADLAQKKLISLSSWDGRQLRDISSWSSPQEFIQSTSDAGHVHVSLASVNCQE